MALETTSEKHAHDAEPATWGRDRLPWWVTGAGAALLAIVFRLGQHAGSSSRTAPADNADRPSGGALEDAPGAAPEHGRRSQGDRKAFLLRIYDDIGRNRIVALAAGVTFYSILALFPALAALVALYGLFADPASIAGHLDSLAGVLPSGAVQVIGDELRRVASQRNETLGLALIVGLGTALWSANAGVKALFDALNLVSSETERRGFIKLNAVSLAFTAAVIGFALLALGAMVVLPLVTGYLGIASLTNDLVQWLRWPVLLIVLMVGLALLYRFGPSCSEPRWRWVTPGSAVAAVLWLIVSVLFSWYAANFGNYNTTYGSLGAVIGFMVWIWISTIVILLGAQIDAEMAQPSACHRSGAGTSPD